jgi:hypothetical protein
MKQYLEYFKGKPCTIITVQVNFRFKEEQMMDYFMGFVENVDDVGIWIIHPTTKCRTFIIHSYIVSITEEQMLLEENPEHAKIIADYRKEKPITSARTAVPGLINPGALAEMARKAKESIK